MRLLGVRASSLEDRGAASQMDLLDGKQRWTAALRAADRLRDRFGESAVSLAGAMKQAFRERTHEAMPRKKKVPSP